MPHAIRPSALILSASAAFATACGEAPTPEPPDYAEAAGEYTLRYSPGWKVYEDGVLVGKVMPGQAGGVALSEGTLDLDALCQPAAPLCPEKALWGAVEISYLEGWGPVLWAHNRDPSVGQIADVRLGIVEPDGAFELASSADWDVQYLANASLSGTFVDGFIDGGRVAWTLQPGLAIGGLVIDQEVRLETEFTGQLVSPVFAAP